jgi:transcriptional regulator with XRE-family HTH domain
LSPDDFRAVLGELGISQARLARLLGVATTTAWRWAAGEVAIPRAVGLLLCALYAKLVTMEQLEALA